MKFVYLPLLIFCFCTSLLPMESNDVIIEIDNEKMILAAPRSVTISSKINDLDFFGLKKLTALTWIISKEQLKEGIVWEPGPRENKIIIFNPFKDIIHHHIKQYILYERFIIDYIYRYSPLVIKEFKPRWFSDTYKVAALNNANTKLAIVFSLQRESFGEIRCMQTGNVIVNLKSMIVNQCNINKIFWALEDTRIITQGTRGFLIWDALTGKLLYELCTQYSWDGAICLNHEKSIIALIKKNNGKTQIDFFKVENGYFLSSIMFKEGYHAFKIINNINLDIISVIDFLGTVKFYDFYGNPVHDLYGVKLNTEANDCICHDSTKFIRSKSHKLIIYDSHQKVDEVTILFGKKDKKGKNIAIKNIAINPLEPNLLLIVYKNSSFITIYDLEVKKILYDIQSVEEDENSSFNISDAEWSPNGKNIMIKVISDLDKDSEEYSILCKFSNYTYYLYYMGRSIIYTWSEDSINLIITQENKISIVDVEYLEDYIEKRLSLEQSLLLLAIDGSHVRDKKYYLDSKSQDIFDTLILELQKLLKPFIVKKSIVEFLSRVNKKYCTLI